MKKIIRIASAQMSSKIGDKQYNLLKICDMIRAGASKNSDLIVFPECSLSGYVYTSKEKALLYAEEADGPATQSISELCKQIGVYVIYGFLEKSGQKLYNTSVLIGNGKPLGYYRKMHLPFLGVDRFTEPGDLGFPVFSTDIGKIGMQICYDLQFPEGSRVMALNGADIIVYSNNFPKGRAEKLNCLVRARAVENKVHVVSCDRIGKEDKMEFDGFSTIIDCDGNIVVRASHDSEQIIYADLQILQARQKHHSFIPGEWEINNIGSRRPDFYTSICNPN